METSTDFCFSLRGREVETTGSPGIGNPLYQRGYGWQEVRTQSVRPDPRMSSSTTRLSEQRLKKYWRQDIKYTIHFRNGKVYGCGMTGRACEKKAQLRQNSIIIMSVSQERLIRSKKVKRPFSVKIDLRIRRSPQGG